MTDATAPIHPRAGKRAKQCDLVDVPALVSAYYTLRPEPEKIEHQISLLLTDPDPFGADTLRSVIQGRVSTNFQNIGPALDA